MLFSTALLFCFAAQFLRNPLTNSVLNPMVLRIQGITTPEGANYTFYNPAPQGLKLSALRAEVDEPGCLRPRLFLLLFFRLRPCALIEARRRPKSASKALTGPATLLSPPRGRTAAHKGKQRGCSRCCLFLCIACWFFIHFISAFYFSGLKSCKKGFVMVY